MGATRLVKIQRYHLFLHLWEAPIDGGRSGSEMQAFQKLGDYVSGLEMK